MIGRISVFALTILLTITTLITSVWADAPQLYLADDGGHTEEEQFSGQDVREEIYESWRIYTSRWGSSPAEFNTLIAPTPYYQGSLSNSLTPTQLYRELGRPGHARVAFRIPRWISVPLAIAAPFGAGAAAASLTDSALHGDGTPTTLAGGLIALTAGTLGFGAGLGISWLVTRDFHPVRSATRDQWIDEYNQGIRQDLGLE